MNTIEIYIALSVIAYIVIIGVGYFIYITRKGLKMSKIELYKGGYK